MTRLAAHLFIAPEIEHATFVAQREGASLSHLPPGDDLVINNHL